MRILSQDGMIDAPYERIIINIDYRNKCHIVAGDCRGEGGVFTVAKYSSEAKAKKAMQMLREAYTGKMDNVLKFTKEFVSLSGGNGIVYFQFPADEDVEKQGLLIRLPCKVGDTVYDLVFCDDGKCHIFEMKVCHISPFGSVRKGKCWNVYLENDYTKAYRSFYDFGKTVFLTQAAAEEALREMKEN